MKVTYIELAGKKHPLCFSLAVSETLDEAFGGLENMQEELYSRNISRISKALDVVLTALMDAGRIYLTACGEGDKLPPRLTCRPADLLDVRDNSIVNIVLSAIMGDSAREVEAVTKNGGATQAL